MNGPGQGSGAIILYLLSSHFFSSLLIGWVAKKFYDRNFWMWSLIAFIVPVISAIFLMFLGYDGIYCPKCNKKVRQKAEFCPHCGFGIKEFKEKDEERKKAAKQILKQR